MPVVYSKKIWREWNDLDLVNSDLKIHNTLLQQYTTLKRNCQEHNKQRTGEKQWNQREKNA